jgi:1,2-phenylacetyl-CoA epoxidase catalytic subunit
VPLVQLRFVPDWASTVARHFLYETADAVRIEALKQGDDRTVAGIAAKIDREEVYHRIHAEMWIDRLGHEPAVHAALEELWGGALGVVDEGLRPELSARLRQKLGWAPHEATPAERGEHLPELGELWQEMTMVRRSAPAGAQW